MIVNSFILAIRSIRRNLMRSLLTVLGVVIGVAAVITMVTLGQGATLQVTEQIASLGSNVLMIRPGQGMRSGGGSAPPFKVSDAAAIAREIHGVDAVAAIANTSARAVYAEKSWTTGVSGVDSQFFTVRNWALTSGRTFSESELRAGAAVAILGETIRRQLFGDLDPVGYKIRLKNVTFQVIGVLDKKGRSAMGQDQDETILVPLRAAQRRLIGRDDISIIQLSVSAGQPTGSVIREIQEIMRKIRRISGSEDDNFSVMDMQEIAGMLAGTTKVLTGLLGAVAAISLLVGGIGIMNIMLVSVTERTREIGIRLAIGALERDVLTQFLVEAVVLSVLGGAIGVVLALIVSFIAASLLQVPFVFSPGIMALAFIFSAGVGVMFGYVPARKAARLDPIEALRYE